MKPAAKVAMVAGGYLAAIILACAAVAVRVVLTSGPDAQAAGGMYAFGDAALFIAVFGLAALMPTGAALFFLRPYRAFWYIVSGLALALASTSIVAAVLYAFGRYAAAPSPLALWAGLAVLRIIIAPLLALTFFICTILSPYRISRLAFLAAAIMEAAVTAYVAVVWFVPLVLNKT